MLFDKKNQKKQRLGLGARRRLASGIPTRGRSSSFRNARGRAARYTATVAPRDDRSVPGASVCARPGWIDRRAASQSRDAARRRSGNRGRGGSRLGRSEKTHQGARNLTKAALPDSRTSASKFAEVRSTAPALAPTTRPMRAIARNATRILTCGGGRGARISRLIPGTVRQRIGTRDRAGGDVRIAGGRARCVLEGEDGRSRRFTRRMGHVPEASLRDLEWVTAGTFVRFVPRRHATFFDQSEASIICFCRPRFSHGFRFSNKSHRTPH
jgi:hypothetical protein